MEMREMSFVLACKDYFGFKEGQTMMEFAGELKALTAQDKDDLSRYFETVGYKIRTA